MDRLPQFVLALANTVEWDSEKECFDTFATVIGDFYAVHQPLLPRPSPKRPKVAVDDRASPAGDSPATTGREACEGEAAALGAGEDGVPGNFVGRGGEERGERTGEGRGGHPGAVPGNERDEDGLDDELAAEAESAWRQRDWTIQHLLFPAMRLFLKPPNSFANDGTFVQVACLEKLYRIFERC
eukprot:TRINITY_DN5760_c0_g1_i1.p1 TRINITY_DN5760_c0_g1~~TRINITY_DN5760_c0_g1_i1.p1  ORF type:complete len:209 (-),score=34.98 TRINITY_DN5760_c0_g1_i1:383-934(-)